MPTALVECIANYSDARRPEVVEAIVESITSVPGVRILDRHSDLDHNRSVLTFVGSPEGVEEAAFRSIAKAAELINLDQHTGEHPRIGATDVVPFVPISGISMEECVEIARRLGERVGKGLGIPVYLYEEAATRPERQNLENIRRGQYEALKVEMGVNPERDPDYGPHRVGTAGATVIGARQPLIAYNIYLTTNDVSVAKKIAKSLRNSSGGYRYLKALGLLVEGRAQVSMNLTNFRETPMARVVETVRREAERYGVGIHHSELVGLIPEEALVDAAVWYMQMDQFEPEQVLERRLYDTAPETPEPVTPGAAVQILGDVTVAPDFLEALASGSATPGGGAAAAYTAAEGAALVAMVARLTIGRKKYAEVEALMQSLLEQAEGLRADLSTAVQRDSSAFEAVMSAMRMTKETPEEQAARTAAVEEATWGALLVPLEVARKALEVKALAVQALGAGNINAISDAATSAALAQAALFGAGYNVRINVKALKDPARASSQLEELYELERRAAKMDEEIHTKLSSRGGIA